MAYGLDRASYNQGENAKFGFSIYKELQPTLTAKGPGAVCADMLHRLWGGHQVSGTVMSRDYKGVCNEWLTEAKIIYEKEKEMKAAVRRLTPTEAVRLQGYPDDWLEIGVWVDSNNKVHKDADSPKYKAAGNSICLPFWYWLFVNISCELKDSGVSKPTLGSLFDGIGGFPRVHQMINGKGTAVWASEIEEFPIAVTKIRFPEDE